MSAEPDGVKLVLAGSAVVLVLFVALPDLDLKVAALFYRRPTEFMLSFDPVAQFLHDLVPWIVGVAVAWTSLPFIASLLSERGWMSRGGWRPVGALLLTLIVGPGLIVNAVLKPEWGRPRPTQVEEFGGRFQFSPVWQPSDACRRNCSFVSGDAAATFALLAPALLTTRRRRWWIALAAAAGCGIGAVRMMQGAHFLSDILFSGLITALVAVLACRTVAALSARPKFTR